MNNNVVKDMTNQRIGRLTVIKRADRKTKTSQAFWECKCDCGKIVVVCGYSLRKAKTVSCGCYNEENRKIHATKHGMRYTRIYQTWRSMKERCSVPSNTSYKDYGARGIRVCEEWKEFNAFYQWAISSGYTDELTIERKNVNGNYEPSNCRWATRQEQSLNKTNTVKATINGVTHTVKEWCEIFDISRSTVNKRIKRNLPQELWFYKGKIPRNLERSVNG